MKSTALRLLWFAVALAGVLLLPMAEGARPPLLSWLATLGLAAIQAVFTLSVGALVIRALRWESPCRVAFWGSALFLGAGAVSTAILILGLVGGLHPLALRFAVPVIGAIGLPLLLPERPRAKLGPLDPLPLLCLFLMSLIVALQCAKIPLAYDTLCYHLAVPKIWLSAGSIFPVPGNFYSHQPFMGEMNFLLALALGAGGLQSLPIALNFAAWLGVVGMGHALARGLGAGRFLSLTAAATLAAMPLILKVTADALVDIWAVLGLQVIAYAWMHWLRTREISAVRMVGLGLGFLITVKHPAAAFWGAPFIVVMGLTMLRAPLADWKRALAWGTPLALVAVLPWWIKEFAWTGNPLFPLGYGVFGGDGWSQTQADLLVAGHGLQSPLSPSYWSGFPARLSSVGDFEGKTFSLIVILAALLAASAITWRRRREPGALVPWLTIMLGLLAWNLLGGGADRFAAPALGLLIPLAFAVQPVRHEFDRWVGLILVPTILLAIHSSLFQDAGPLLFNPHLNYGQPHIDAHRRINYEAQSTPETKVLLVYEARTFNLNTPAVFGTVFDGQPLRDFVQGCETIDDLLSRLRDEEITHVTLNLHEANRLMLFYFGDPPENPFSFEGYRPFWDFPTPLTDTQWRVIADFHRWIIENQITNGVGVHITRIPE